MSRDISDSGAKATADAIIESVLEANVEAARIAELEWTIDHYEAYLAGVGRLDHAKQTLDETRAMRDRPVDAK